MKGHPTYPQKCRFDVDGSCVTVEAVVLYEYTAQDTDELTLKKGDIVTDIKVREGGWWEGTSKDGRRGLFPDNFVKVERTLLSRL